MLKQSLGPCHREWEFLKNVVLSAIKNALPDSCIDRNVFVKEEAIVIGTESFKVSEIDNIRVVGFGKASVNMARALVNRFKGQDDILKRLSGLVITKYDHVGDVKVDQIEFTEAAHPVPDENGTNFAQKVVSQLDSCTEKDLVIFLVSGGGSSLLSLPRSPVSLKDLQDLSGILLRCGATIDEINTLRKHLSAVKGGQLAKIAYPAKMCSLILSDVIGDPLDIIASGPTVPDTGTFDDCRAVLDKYSLWEEIPESVTEVIKSGLKADIPETPKLGDVELASVHNFIIGSNSLALNAAAETAEKLGLETIVIPEPVEGEASDLAKRMVQMAKDTISLNKVSDDKCGFIILGGGETTVTIKGTGLGGRNQEFALQAALEIDGLDGFQAFGVGTDGTDGPNDAAGACVTSNTVEYGKSKGLNASEYMENNDSYHFFESLGQGHLMTGPTGTNVMDVYGVIVMPN